jgi:hypothetical protein
VFGLTTAALASYLWRQERSTRELRSQLRQRAELQKRAMQDLPSDQSLYPHAKAAIGYVFNPFMKKGTLWAPKERPYAINAWGLRGAEIGPKAPGRKRIVLLGDSWFFGWLLGDEDRLENHMRALLGDPAYEVVTLAVPGWNVRSEASFLESHIRVIDPDAIVWEICANDNWQVGGVIPPGGLSLAFSPQNREPEGNALTVLHDPLPLMPFTVDRYLENLALMDGVRSRYGIPVLAAPVLPSAAWEFLAERTGHALPSRLAPRVLEADRRAWVSETDNHPSPWMNHRMALGYVSKLAEMGVVPRRALHADQEAIVREWDRANSRPPSQDEIEAFIGSVMEQVPDAYTAGDDLRRVAAGVDEGGGMGRHGLLYLRTGGPRSALTLELDVDEYAARFARELKVSARSFEREEAAGTVTFSGAAQRVTCRVPLPARASRYPVYEVEWRFNYDQCGDPTRCTAARLARVHSE